MPSTVMVPASGGIGLVQSGDANMWSGQWPRVVGGLQLRYDVSGPGTIYISPGPLLSGIVVTQTSGTSGVPSYTDGMVLAAGDAFFIPKQRLCSGLETPRVGVPAAASGGFLFWEPF